MKKVEMLPEKKIMQAISRMRRKFRRGAKLTGKDLELYNSVRKGARAEFWLG